MLAAGDGDAAVSAPRSLLERACAEVRLQRGGPDDSPLALLVAALEGSQAERVLVLQAADAAPPAALILALVAWPESPVVHPAGSWACAIYRRSIVLPAARACIAEGETAVEALAARVEVGELAGSDLEAISSVG